ncbi:F-box/FBD/LRR-repeat protein At1g13570-like [Rutidosis leptorrhynchoides]|uniref:F-box/FBD/LRR-repeat protein At1g13570-like n=1 Tax=Rutidosis leptorrhynchoides TaxID=125765 RepID=UPI003A9A1C42
MPFLALLLRASPNVEKIKLHTCVSVRIYPVMLETDSDADEQLDVGQDYSDIQLKNLTELEIKTPGIKKVELDFVKFMLVRSPVLKTLRISINKNVTEDTELEILNVLLNCPRASPVVNINLHR